MTEDYKEQLLNYVTGNLEPTSPTTDEIFKEIVEIPRSEWIDFLPVFTSIKINGYISSEESKSDIGILYGGYRATDNNVYGIIILVDNNFKPIKTIYEFSGGTKLRYIQCMEQQEDGTLCFIDDTALSSFESPSETSQKRFVLVNNFTIGNKEVILRKSYIFSGSDYIDFFCSEIYKNPNSSHYVFVGTASRSRGKIIEFKINVGSENEWHYWFLNDTYAWRPQASYVLFDSNDEFKIKLLTYANSSYNVYLQTKDYSSSTLNTTTIYTNSDSISISGQNSTAIFLNENEIYFYLTNQYFSSSVSLLKYSSLYYYNISNNSLQQIYSNTFGYSTSSMFKEFMQIKKIQGKVYIAFYDYNDDNYETDIYIQRLENNIWNPNLIKENANVYPTLLNLYMGSQFNLLKYVVMSDLAPNTWTMINIKEIYNPTQYNGEPYIDINALIPLYSNLYSNGSLIFSRNLYNISKQNNMTMSSVEIPNNYLNDTTITQNDLISETNLQMNSNLQNWTKNIYEVVDLNFLNTISVIDEDTSETYLQGAIRINNAITDINDYSNMTCNKVRINYTDNTTNILSINWTQIDELNKETEFSINVDKPILSIDYISNDENTIYCSKQLEVEVGKTYTINQKIGVIQ